MSEHYEDVVIHPSAIVDAGAKLGKGTRVWHFSHVCSTAEVGENCSLGQNVYVANTVRLGNGVKVQNNVSIYEGVTLEDFSFCGPSMVFTNVHNPRSHIVRKHEYRQTLVKQGASIGANATVICGNTLGRYCFIGAGAVVTRDVPDFALVVGNPGRIAGWMCSCGIKLTSSAKLPEMQTITCTSCGLEYVFQNTRLCLLEKP